MAVILFVRQYHSYNKFGLNDSVLGNLGPSTNTSLDNVSPWIHQFAKTMEDFYGLYIEMRYLHAEAVIYGPHRDMSISRAQNLGYSTEAIQLLQLFPYVDLNAGGDVSAWNYGPSNNDFFMGGEFCDYRSDSELKQGRDPFYAIDERDESIYTQGDFDAVDGPYMRPHYVALNSLGNHGALLIVPGRRKEGNRNALEVYPSRDAIEAMEGYMKRFRELEWLPGGVYPDEYIGNNYKRLYIENGWPGNFSGAAFDAARNEYEQAETERYHKESPFREVEKFEMWLKSGEDAIVRYEGALVKLALTGESVTEDGETVEMFQEKIRKAKEDRPMLKKELEKAKQEAEAVSEDVKQARYDRIQKYGYRE
ncbi:hypothetical protein B0O99DRAFT_689824 [Bisporella sp. PMI_857]|nr:hypothetical protein B0O99DRAFT_689824 [Bisporella sp. PMI_857]